MRKTLTLSFLTVALLGGCADFHDAVDAQSTDALHDAGYKNVTLVNSKNGFSIADQKAAYKLCDPQDYLARGFRAETGNNEKITGSVCFQGTFGTDKAIRLKQN